MFKFFKIFQAFSKPISKRTFNFRKLIFNFCSELMSKFSIFKSILFKNLFSIYFQNQFSNFNFSNLSIFQFQIYFRTFRTLNQFSIEFQFWLFRLESIFNLFSKTISKLSSILNCVIVNLGRIRVKSKSMSPFKDLLAFYQVKLNPSAWSVNKGLSRFLKS